MICIDVYIMYYSRNICHKAIMVPILYIDRNLVTRSINFETTWNRFKIPLDQWGTISCIIVNEWSVKNKSIGGIPSVHSGMLMAETSRGERILYIIVKESSMKIKATQTSPLMFTLEY